MKPFRLSALAVALFLAACTAAPTSSAGIDSAAPSFNGGGSLGSGNHTSEDGGNGLGSGNLTETETTVPVDTTARGPGMLGSGN